MIYREQSIDILKFIAAILITNSHLEQFETSYPLSTGGSIGDIIFLFCSGFTLFIGKIGRFDNWYKRRLMRIFPPVICWGIIAAFFFQQNDSIKYLVIEGGGWFIQCILIYYLLAYPIRRFASKNIDMISISVIIISFVWYLCIPKDNNFGMYGWNYCKWAFFFLFFLQGAKFGLSNINRTTENIKPFWPSFIYLIICLCLWYATLYIIKCFNYNPNWQFISLLPLLGVSKFFYKVTSSNLIIKIYHKKMIYNIIRFIGGLCFEIYIVQMTLLNLSLSIKYPHNIIAIITLIIVFAYILRVVTNFTTQTFQPQNYDWKAIFKVY